MDLSSLKTRLGISTTDSNGTGYHRNETPTPLSVLFYIYETGHPKDLYVDYMEGFRLVVQWLAPHKKPCNPHPGKIPRLHGSYEMQQIAAILDIPYHTIYQEYNQWILDSSSSLIPHD